MLSEAASMSLIPYRVRSNSELQESYCQLNASVEQRLSAVPCSQRFGFAVIRK
jgi:hypothetical protein